MKLKWLGHAAFLITSESGTRIITDPYTPDAAGYAPISDEADLVIISSDNDRFHCRADLIPGTPTVINALELARNGSQQTVKDMPIRAIEAMEALNHQFHDPDQNGMYRFEVDGIHIGHLGDMGNALSAEQIAFFQGVDVLLALAGGHPTLELDDLKVLINAVKPKLVVPMHFRTLRYKPRNTFWIERFLSYFDDKQVDFACDYEIEINYASLPATTRVMVLTHSQ
jgi:L-ascorbate metabolism protein UlaG (beta-lactamase superfamily)